MNIHVVHNFFAHYRGPVLRQLAHLMGKDASLVLHGGAPTGSQANIPLMADLEDTPPIANTLKNVWLGQLLWQSGLVLAVLRSPRADAWIFLGDAHYASTWLAALVARARGQRVLFWTHGARKPLKGIKLVVQRLFYSIPDSLLLYGHRGEALVKAAGITTTCHVIYNSLDYPRQRAIAEGATKVTRASNRVLFCARLDDRKRVDLLIDACGIIARAGRDLTLTIIGDGPARPALEERARRAGLSDRVTFTGSLYKEDELAPHFLAASIFVIPETAGLSVMHAMGYGLPVITVADPEHQMPETEAVIAGKTGDFFERGNADDLALVIARWLSREDSVDRSAACVHMIATQYSPEAQARRILRAALEQPKD